MYSMLTKFVTDIYYLRLFSLKPCVLQGYPVFKERRMENFLMGYPLYDMIKLRLTESSSILTFVIHLSSNLLHKITP